MWDAIKNLLVSTVSALSSTSIWSHATRALVLGFGDLRGATLTVSTMDRQGTGQSGVLLKPTCFNCICTLKYFNMIPYPKGTRPWLWRSQGCHSPCQHYGQTGYRSKWGAIKTYLFQLYLHFPVLQYDPIPQRYSSFVVAIWGMPLSLSALWTDRVPVQVGCY